MKDYIWHPCTQMKDHEDFPLIKADRAQGIYIYDEKGKVYMDMISSWWCNLLGHNHPDIKQAVKDQLDKMEHIIFAGFTHEPAEELCRRLVRLLPSGLCRFFFVDNGSSAVEVAMKMSFQYHQQTGAWQRQKFMTLANGYHGETLGALSVGDMDVYTKKFEQFLLPAIPVPGPTAIAVHMEEIGSIVRLSALRGQKKPWNNMVMKQLHSFWNRLFREPQE